MRQCDKRQMGGRQVAAQPAWLGVGRAGKQVKTTPLQIRLWHKYNSIFWLFNHNNLVVMFKCLKYHAWVNTSGKQLENLAKSKNIFRPLSPIL